MNYRSIMQLFLVFCLLVLGSSLRADIVGVHAGIVHWANSWDGEVDTAEIGENADIDDDTSTGFYLAAELPIPLLPNVRIQNTPLSGQGESSRIFGYEREIVSVGTDLDLQFNLFDAIAYAEIFDNWVSLDIGLAIRHFDAEFVIGNELVEDKASDITPLIYAGARADLPLSGWYSRGEFLGFGSGDSKLNELKLGIGYESKYRMGGELGYRQNTLELDDVDGLSTGLSTDGVYLALTLSI